MVEVTPGEGHAYVATLTVDLVILAVGIYDALGSRVGEGLLPECTVW